MLNVSARDMAKSLRDGLSVVGFVLIVGAMAIYNTSIPTPGVFSLIPVFGSVILIAVGPDALINRSILSWRALTFVGLISYSLYLWHWPLISYLHIVTPQAPQWHFAVALLLAFPLSIFTYFVIENPIRRSKSSKAVVGLLIAALACCFALGQVIRSKDGFLDRPIAQSMGFANDFTYTNIMRKHTLLGVPVRVSDATIFPEILFIGDSHIEQYAPRAKVLADQKGISVAFLTGGGCFASIGLAGHGEKCSAIPNQIQTLLKDDRIKTIVIGQMWGSYMHERKDDFPRGVQAYIDLIKKFGKGRKVFVLLDCPWDYGSYDLKRRVTNRLDVEAIEKNDFTVPYPKDTHWKEGNLYIEGKLSAIANLIKTEHLVCPNGMCNLRNYKDDDHLRSSYVTEYAVWLDQVFR